MGFELSRIMFWRVAREPGAGAETCARFCNACALRLSEYLAFVRSKISRNAQTRATDNANRMTLNRKSLVLRRLTNIISRHAAGMIISAA